jgi:hypothetical protein
MASETDPIAPRTWVAIDIAKGVNVVLVEHSDGRQQEPQARPIKPNWPIFLISSPMVLRAMGRNTSRCRAAMD